MNLRPTASANCNPLFIDLDLHGEMHRSVEASHYNMKLHPI